MKTLPETHQEGLISVSQNLEMGDQLGDFGIQIAKDGRVWICINGLAAIRFKPVTKSMMKIIKEKLKGDSIDSK